MGGQPGAVDLVHGLQSALGAIVRRPVLDDAERVGGLVAGHLHHGHLDAALGGQALGRRQVLVHQAQHLRARLGGEFRGVHPVAQPREGRRAGRVGLLDHLDQHPRIHPGGLGQRGGLVRGAPGAVGQDVTRDLGGHARAQRAAVHDLLGEVGQHRHGPTHAVVVAADHGDHAVVGGLVTGRHAAVQHGHAVGAALLGHIEDLGHRQRRQQGDDQAGTRAGEHAVGAAQHLAHLGGVDDGEQHDVADRGDLGRRRRRERQTQLLGRLGADVVDHGDAPAGLQADRNPAADHAQTDHAGARGDPAADALGALHGVLVDVETRHQFLGVCSHCDLHHIN